MGVPAQWVGAWVPMETQMRKLRSLFVDEVPCLWTMAVLESGRLGLNPKP